MKKSLLALAVLGAYVGVATAQSSVSMYGTVDLSGTYIKNDGADERWAMTSNGINSSQLGFRGVEDLGGGLRAGFNLIADLAPIDSGNVGGLNTAGKFFGRRATVSLFTNAGELRLGRDYTPDFWNQTIFDAFGTNGIGSSTNVRQLYHGTRRDNAIGYFLPGNVGGFYGQFMAAPNEGGTQLDRPGRYLGARGGFAAGPFDIAIAYGETRYGVPFIATGLTGTPQVVPVAQGSKQKTMNIGGSWDFGFLKLLAYFNMDEVDLAEEKNGSVSAVIPLGQGEIHVGYDRSELDRDNIPTVTPGPTCCSDSTVDQWKVTYQYNLSKRTAMYATASLLDNHDNATRLSLTGPGGSNNNTGSFGGKAKGFQLGVRHFF